MTGKVSLVGAGPGDTGLLTLKALKLIKEADIVIYDYLVNPAHLRLAKPESLKICLGKGFRHHRLSQNKINRLIISAARKGRRVVRLKGGDPYLFGRGGEEALFLFKHRIPFEVVPGVTSATACAAYAGIPLTHREHNASVTFLTGHRAHDDNLDGIDWEKITGLGGTLVIYMGFYNLEIITKKLIRSGMKPSTKISVIQWGTLTYQKSCEGTLADITKKVKKAGLSAPSIIIVGEVVSLSKNLNWFEKLPLFGKRIVVTRTRDKASSLSQNLESLGAVVMEFPVIEIKPINDYLEMDTTIKTLLEFDWVIFTSTYGVDAFFERLEKKHKKDARWLATIKVACVGPETAEALKKRGVLPDLLPNRFETKALVVEFKNRFKKLAGQNVLLVRTDIAPPDLEIGLRTLGANLKRVTAYRTVTPRHVSLEIKKELLKNGADYVTFTSSSTVDHFVRIVGLKNVKALAKKGRFVSIGPVTSKTLKSYGLKPACQARVFTVQGMIDAVLKNKRGK